MIRADFFQRLFNAFELLEGVVMRNVDQVNQEIGFNDFFERGTERRDELGRKFADESDRIGKQAVASSWKSDAARRRVERCEKLVSDVNVGV